LEPGQAGVRRKSISRKGEKLLEKSRKLTEGGNRQCWKKKKGCFLDEVRVSSLGIKGPLWQKLGTPKGLYYQKKVGKKGND